VKAEWAKKDGHMGASNYVSLPVSCIIKETDKALCVEVIGGSEITTVWLPKSQVANADEYEEGDKDCTLSITEWICEQKGLEEFIEER
jgi:hypothetical protein